MYIRLQTESDRKHRHKKARKDRSSSPKKRDRGVKESSSRAAEKTDRDKIKDDKKSNNKRSEANGQRNSRPMESKSAEELENMRARLLTELKGQENNKHDNQSAMMEPVSASSSNEEDDLPVGSDYSTLASAASKSADSARPETANSATASGNADRTQQLPLRKADEEDSFPLTKSGDVVAKKPSEILSKVLEKKSASFLPRTLKLSGKVASTSSLSQDFKAREDEKDETEKSANMASEALRNIEQIRKKEEGSGKKEDEHDKYLLAGPIRRKFGNDPNCAEDDDELKLAPVKAVNSAEKKEKKITIGNLKSTTDVLRQPKPESKHVGEEGSSIF